MHAGSVLHGLDLACWCVYLACVRCLTSYVLLLGAVSHWMLIISHTGKVHTHTHGHKHTLSHRQTGRISRDYSLLHRASFIKSVFTA